MTAAPALKYYSFDKVLSFNAKFNFIVGARGLGKTYGAKMKALQWAIRRGDQFIYLRRYKTELQAARNTFFADIEDAFPNYDFRIVGNTAQMATSKDRGQKAKDRTWSTIGFFIALSTAQTQKSVSFPKVKTIIFDEFIIEKGATSYLPDESRALQNFYATVDRWKDKTRVFFLANSVSIMNPYFLAYRIRPDELEEYSVHGVNPETGKPFIVAHFADSAEFTNAVYQTEFGRFIEGTEYAEYAVGNEFKDNHDGMLGPKPSHAKYLMTLEVKPGTFSVWVDVAAPEGTTYWFQEKRPKQEILCTTVAENMTEDKKLLTYSDKLLQYMRSAFQNGNAYFDTPKTRNAFIEVFKR